MGKTSWQAKEKYNAATYVNINMKLRPELAAKLEEVKIEGESRPELIERLVNIPIVNEKRRASMQKIMEQAKSKDGIWVIGRNMNAELFPMFNEQQKKQIMKIVGKEKEVDVYTLFGEVPNLATYKLENVRFEETADGIQMNTIGKPVKTIDINEGENGEQENLKSYLERFFETTEMTREEYETYRVGKEADNLPVVKVVRMA